MTSLKQNLPYQTSVASAAVTPPIISAVLRNPTQFFEEIRQGSNITHKILRLFLVSITFLGIYGAILGSGHALQSLSAAIKLPLIFIGGLVACTPALYIFDILLGSERSLSQTIAVLLTAVSVISILLFGFVPITIVFRLTVNGFQFFKLLNVAFLIIAVLVGAVYLERGLRLTLAPNQRDSLWRDSLYILWIFVFIFVISQMAWGLRPFFHFPGSSFMWLVGGSNLITDFFQAAGEFMGFWVVR